VTQTSPLICPSGIGSSRLASTPTRSIYFDGAYAPFGEGYAETGTADLSFTGMNQDTVSNLYDFPDREYSIQGRWPSPDPAGITSVDPRNPQSWNRYAYVLNNPLGFMDPTGEGCAVGNNQNQNQSQNQNQNQNNNQSPSTTHMICSALGAASLYSYIAGVGANFAAGASIGGAILGTGIASVAAPIFAGAAAVFAGAALYCYIAD
jgi:RHS repeat-associated protein